MSLIREYRSDMGSNELCILNPEEVAAPEFYEKMINGNKLQGLLKFRVDLVEGRKKYVFNADGMRPVSAVFQEKKPNFEMLGTILEGIINIATNTRQYLLSEQDFVILPDCMFLDSKGKLALCCLPGFEHPLKEQFSSFFEYLMNWLDYDDQNAVYVLYSLYRKSKEAQFNFEDIKQILEQKQETAKDAEKALPKPEPVRLEKPKALPELPVQEKTPPAAKPTESGRTRRSLFGAHKSKEVQPPAQEATMLLHRAATDSDFVLRAEDGREIIYLSCFPFYIGKSTANIHCSLDYPQISRMHAKISNINGELRITDSHSTNGVSVNGERIPAGEPVSIKPNDKISLANRVYVLEERSL